jgi:hypothetical protein
LYQFGHLKIFQSVVLIVAPITGIAALKGYCLSCKDSSVFKK